MSTCEGSNKLFQFYGPVTWSFWISKLASSMEQFSGASSCSFHKLNKTCVLHYNWALISMTLWGQLRFRLSTFHSCHHPNAFTDATQPATTLPKPFKKSPAPGTSYLASMAWGHGCMETSLTLGGGWDASWKIHLQIERSSQNFMIHVYETFTMIHEHPQYWIRLVCLFEPIPRYICMNQTIIYKLHN